MMGHQSHLLDEVVLVPGPDAEDIDGMIPLVGNPGQVMINLVREGQARGCLAGVTCGFTATHDSAGESWPDTVDLRCHPFVTYRVIVDALRHQPLIAEWGITEDYRFDLFAPRRRHQ